MIFCLHGSTLGPFFDPKFSHPFSHIQPQPAKPFLLGTIQGFFSLETCLEFSFPLRYRLISNLPLSLCFSLTILSNLSCFQHLVDSSYILGFMLDARNGKVNEICFLLIKSFSLMGTVDRKINTIVSKMHERTKECVFNST